MRSTFWNCRLPGACFAATLLLLGGPAAFVHADVPRDGSRSFSGRAVAADTGELLYTEYHTQTYADGKLRKIYVNYAGPDGATLAVRSATFGNGFVPRSRYDNRQAGTVTTIRPAGGGYAVAVQDGTGTSNSGVVRAGAPAVAGLGLDPFIRSVRDQWVAGRPVSFQMIVPSRMSAYPFRLSKAGERSLGGRAAVVLRLELAGLLGYLVDDIRLTYDRGTGDLLMYEGPAELKDPAGRERRIRVTFRY